MKRTILKKAFSLTAAAAICCSTLPSLSCFASAASVSAENAAEENTVRRSNFSNEIVPVIVRVSGKAVMERPEAAANGADFLDTAQAAKIKNQLVSVQRRVQNNIRSIYPDLSVSYSYQVLVNGFSCELPEQMIEEVSKLPNVESVTKVSKHTAPKMSKAAALSGFPAYYDQTGCTGEGQVIAVIDSELDVTHPMFAPLAEDIETALSKDDIAEIVSSGTLNVDVDPERAYISSKLPFVIDYAGDPYEGIPEPSAYHGTHVSGIAAGNQIEDADGNTISGIARDAQLIFMGVSAGYGWIDDAAAIAAAEDAVKLRADVINMSWGSEVEYFGDNPMSEAITNAENAGIVVCVAAGNADNGKSAYGRLNDPSNPDVSTMDDKAELGSSALFVASAENNCTVQRHTFVFNGERIVYRPSVGLEEMYLDSYIEPGEYEYVDCGLGLPEEFESLDLEGKVAVIQRSDELFLDDAIYNAAVKGAVAAIVIDKEIPDGMDYLETFMLGFASALVTYEEGQMLLEAENKVITIDSETVPQDLSTRVSSYTSWGVKESLDLRPDIMGIGGNVESAAYDQEEMVLSGTSMASPYLCGCVAVMRQHMEKLNLGLEGREKVKYIRNLLMDSAVPYTENDMYVTPRRQGAGLVSLDRMLADKVIVTGPEGDAKVNLYDNLSDQFSFDVNLSNISEEDVTFTNAKLLLTTDSTAMNMMFGLEEISGQQVLSCSADLSGLVNIAAGESRTETVNVSLDPAQCAALRETFVNGFFAEGYLVLEGAENCCDISIPLLGFCGDWAQIPVYKEGTLVGETQFGGDAYPGTLPLAESILKIADVSKSIPKFLLDGNLRNYNSLLFMYANMEDLYAITEQNNSDAYVSVNGDGISDSIALQFQYVRQSKIKGLNIYDEDGNLVMEGHEFLGGDRSWSEVNWGIGADSLDSLPEGKYTGVAECVIDYPTSYENPQKLSIAFTIDNTAPAVESEFITRNGRKILRLTASDENVLDGIYITGQGKGGLAESYDPNAANQGVDYAFAIGAILSSYVNPGSFEYLQYDDSSRSILGRILTGSADSDEVKNIGFTDVIPAECDENGSFTIEYDVTDLTAYTVDVLDKAYNFTTLTFDQPLAEALNEGIWMTNDGFYGITADTISYISCLDGSRTDYSYTISEGVVTMTDANGNDTSFFAEIISNAKMRFSFDESGVKMLTRYSKADDLEDIKFITVEEMLPRFKEEFASMYDTEAVNADIIFVSPERVIATIDNGADPDSEEYVYDMYEMNLMTGEGGNYMSYLIFGDETAIEVPAGVYFDGMDYYSFNEDGASGSVFHFFPMEEGADPEDPFTYATDEDGIMTVTFADQILTGTMHIMMSGDLEFETEDGMITYLMRVSDEPITIDTFHDINELFDLVFAYETTVSTSEPMMMMASITEDGTFYCQIDSLHYYEINPFTLTGTFWLNDEVDLQNPPTLPKKAYALEELCSMAGVDYEKRTGNPAPYVEARILTDGNVRIMIMNEYGGLIEMYTVNPVNGKGENLDGASVNLPKTGILNPDSMVAAVSAALMMMLGTGICVKSVRRREED